MFSGAINHKDNGIEEGDTVRVITAEGEFIAAGHYQNGSIAVRVLTFDPDDIEEADDAKNAGVADNLGSKHSDVSRSGLKPDFWKKRIAEAAAMRRAIGLIRDDAPSTSDAVGSASDSIGKEVSVSSEKTDIDSCGRAGECRRNSTFRLVHGEGDSLPGLIIDVYGPTAVMQAHSVGMHLARKQIAEAVVEVMQGRVESVFYKSESTLSFVNPETGFLIGGSEDDTTIENGLRFHVDWLKGQKTGFFIDQRENRALLERYAAGKKVLNMFCYTGGFSVYAMRGGATEVHSVDSSEKAIELTCRNIDLNFPCDARHKAFCDDAFKFLDGIGNDYDIIILDPPAFAKHRGAIHNAIKGYTRLNRKAFEKASSGTIIFTFSCSQVITKDMFRNAVFTAAAQAKKRVRILHQLHQPADHPINIYHPEGEYLKGLVLYVED